MLSLLQALVGLGALMHVAQAAPGVKPPASTLAECKAALRSLSQKPQSSSLPYMAAATGKQKNASKEARG